MIKCHHKDARREWRSTWIGVHLGQVSRGSYDPRWLNNDAKSSPPTDQAAVIRPARYACRRAFRAFQQHFEGRMPCEPPRCAHPPAACREPRQGRSPPWRPDRAPAMIGIVCSEAARPAVKPRYARSPLNNHRSGDQQYKKDRHQYRRYQPLTKIECGEFWHMTALLVKAGAQRSQSPITARGAR